MQYHNRHSLRLPNYDYSSPGAYFITLVTWKREILFGDINADENLLNEIGDLVSNQWRRLPSRFPNIQIDEFIVMPNHVHGIIIILDTQRPSSLHVGARQKEPSIIEKPAYASPLQNASPYIWALL